jgi:peptide/nickel transport system permease protein
MSEDSAVLADARLTRGSRTTRDRGAVPRFAQRVLRDPRGAFAVAVLTVLLLFAFVIPVVVTTSPFDSVRGERLLHPSTDHLFGTDELSRDLFIRNAIGLRSTLIGGIFAVIAGGLAGIFLGYTAGYRGGWIDSVISRAIDTLLAFPGILLAILLIAIFGAGATSLSLAIAIFNVPFSTRLARATVLREVVRDYVLAAETIGCSGRRILYRHISVNTFGVFAVQLPIAIVNSILIIAALGFLGLGEQPPNPSLGGLLNDGRRFMRLAWWYLVFPAAIVGLLMIALNFLSDLLGEMLDPVRRGRG